MIRRFAFARLAILCLAIAASTLETAKASRLAGIFTKSERAKKFTTEHKVNIQANFGKCLENLRMDRDQLQYLPNCQGIENQYDFADCLVAIVGVNSAHRFAVCLFPGGQGVKPCLNKINDIGSTRQFYSRM